MDKTFNFFNFFDIADVNFTAFAFSFGGGGGEGRGGEGRGGEEGALRFNLTAEEEDRAWFFCQYGKSPSTTEAEESGSVYFNATLHFTQ